MKKTVELNYRDLKIAYEVDMKSVTELANQYGIEFADMKNALRQYGFTIRKGEPKQEAPQKAYEVVLVDTDKIVVETPKTVLTVG